MTNIFTKDRLIELNKEINRLDIEKDAFKPKINIDTEGGNNLFIYCADQMFGNLDKYSRQLSKIENIFKKYNKGKVANYNSYDNKYDNFLPSIITHSIYDTGVNPRNINNKIKIINTPGSYIDTATKIKHDEECCFSDILTTNDFKMLGIDNINELRNTDKINILDTSIVFTFDKVINPKFNKLINNIAIRPQYFKGNSIKNEWFNNNVLKFSNHGKEHYKTEVIKEGKIYILCKLLGDLLQAYYCKLYLDKLPKEKRNSCCIFTLDNILRLRSILLNIPVLYNVGKGMDTLETTYQTSDPNIDTHFKKLYYDIMKNHNDSIIEHINSILTIGYFYVNKQRIIINEKIKSILAKLITYINIKTIAAKNLDNPILEIYRKQIYSYMGHHIFHKMNNHVYICYTDIQVLFPGLEHKTDIIAKTGHKLSDIFLASLGPQKGGDKEEPVEYTIGSDYQFDYEITTDEEFNIKIKELLFENPGEGVKLSLYYTASKYEFEDEWDKFDAIYNIYNNLFNLYTYNGKTIMHLDFLEKVFTLYANEELSKMKPAEFNKVIEDWVKMQPDEEELEAKRIDEWGKKFENKEEKKRKRNASLNNTLKRSRISIFSPVIRTKQNKTKRISRGRGGRRNSL